ncbi:hypothetical protein [Kurthia sp. Dielmo]|uniref:hypothetical protein n=1 Tax=Kurthia sp. Dielmo TaxID=1033738 RepID=UPI00112409BF|nr:hypothetical protein [Kurthia sp. Dielmo]
MSEDVVIEDLYSRKIVTKIKLVEQLYIGRVFEKDRRNLYKERLSTMPSKNINYIFSELREFKISYNRFFNNLLIAVIPIFLYIYFFYFYGKKPSNMSEEFSAKFINYLSINAILVLFIFVFIVSITVFIYVLYSKKTIPVKYRRNIIIMWFLFLIAVYTLSSDSELAFFYLIFVILSLSSIVLLYLACLKRKLKIVVHELNYFLNITDNNI